MADREDITNGTNPEGDPVEFLFTNKKYHDCHLTVGNPDDDDVERIGVSSTQLIAHSSVFRDMLADSPLADPSGDNTHIKDVSPATFKLMLRHVYGGKLPKMTSEEAAALALCADKYNIPRLLGKATKRLKPTDVENFFPALKVVIFIKCPDLENDVTKFVQQKTDKIVRNPKFLELDENEILFIVKQNALKIREVEVWNNVVRWAENQVKNNPDKNVRSFLSVILPHVRLLALSVEEITNHVLPTKILSEKESVDLILARTSKQDIQIPGLCDSRVKRSINQDEYVVAANSLDHSLCNEVECESVACSTLTIDARRKLQLNTLTLKTFKAENKDYSLRSNNLNLKIEICAISNGRVGRYRCVSLDEQAVPNQTITVNVHHLSYPVILEANTKYTLKMTTSPPLPPHVLKYRGEIQPFPLHRSEGVVYVSFEDPHHITKIAFQVLE